MITIEDFYQVKNNTYGNPRYVLHFLAFLTPKDKFTSLTERYALALKRARKFSGRKFHNKQFGGGIVFESYNLHDLTKRINSYLAELEAK